MSAQHKANRRASETAIMMILFATEDKSPKENLTMSRSMPSSLPRSSDRTLANFNRSPVDQVLENLRQALRVLELVPSDQTDLTPHPLVIVRAEIENARRYLSNIKFEEAHQPLLEVA